MESRMYGWERGKGKNEQDSIDESLPLTWHHLALVYNGHQQLLFVNGELLRKKHAAKPGPLKRERPLVIGGFETKGGLRSSRGLLRSIRISRAALYDSDFTPPELLRPSADTVLLYDFGNSRDWLTSEEIPDLSGREKDGQLCNAWWIGHPE